MFSGTMQIERIKGLVDYYRVRTAAPGSHHRGRDISGSRPHSDANRLRHGPSLRSTADQRQWETLPVCDGPCVNSTTARNSRPSGNHSRPVFRSVFKPRSELPDTRPEIGHQGTEPTWTKF